MPRQERGVRVENGSRKAVEREWTNFLHVACENNYVGSARYQGAANGTVKLREVRVRDPTQVDGRQPTCPGSPKSARDLVVRNDQGNLCIERV